MIVGSHIVIYTRDPQADRAFFRDVLGFSSVDAGEGWLIFALPPSEAAFHPSDENNVHEFFLMCKDLKATMAWLAGHNVPCSEPVTQAWGIRTTLQLPGGGKLGLYQPRHPVAAPI